MSILNGKRARNLRLGFFQPIFSSRQSNDSVGNHSKFQDTCNQQTHKNTHHQISHDSLNRQGDPSSGSPPGPRELGAFRKEGALELLRSASPHILQKGQRGTFVPISLLPGTLFPEPCHRGVGQPQLAAEALALWQVNPLRTAVLLS